MLRLTEEDKGQTAESEAKHFMINQVKRFISKEIQLSQIKQSEHCGHSGDGRLAFLLG